MWKRQTVEIKSSLFLQVQSRRVRTNRRRRLQILLALNNRRRCLNLVCLLLLLIPQRIPQFLVQFVPVVSFFKIQFIVIFSQKHDSQYATELPALRPVYTLIVFKYGTPHTEVVYPHQIIFRALEERGTHLFPLFLPFCSNRSKQAVYA